MKLLIAGSRAASPQMLKYAHACVLRAKAQNWHVLVGDAYGIDEAVVRACEQERVPYTAYGVQVRARNRAKYYSNTGLVSFTARDEYMVTLADKVMAIWNGASKGTLHVYQMARQAGKTAWLMHYSWWLHPESDSVFYAGFLPDDPSLNLCTALSDTQAQKLLRQMKRS
jgi:hypothetical protein